MGGTAAFEGFRLELVEGVLSYVVTPKSHHQRATTRASDRMDDQLPAGIPRYWIIDIDGPVTLTSYVLVDGTYELAGEFTGTAVLEAAGHPITLDLEALRRD